jgi:hypothetical protein
MVLIFRAQARGSAPGCAFFAARALDFADALG